MDGSYFDREYFECGLESGKSAYQNYRWLPDFTLPMTVAMIDYLGIERGQTVLDWGCSKGYLVKAFRLLGRPAFGVDISPYALKNIDPAVEKYCCHVEFLMKYPFDFCIAKDVFEHIPINILSNVLDRIDAKTLFAIIPLGKDGEYNAFANNIDKSHVICEDKDWWISFFKKNGWNIIIYSNEIDGIKESYRDVPEAHGFFTLKRSKFC